ncbi:MAG: transposase [Spirochaetes bacterium]|nr:transposase [Spirochaetota bacterium]
MAKLFHFWHTGFSVYANRRKDIKKSNEASVKEFEQLARYIAKPHFSLNAMHYVPETSTVLYKGTMHNGNKSNFRIYKATDFLAAITSHIPKHRQKYLNYYGVYSNKSRGRNTTIKPPPMCSVRAQRIGR